LDPRCRVVQFSSPLSDAELRKVADFMRGYPEVPLRVYGHYGEGCNLNFLRYFPFLRQFQVDVFDLQDIDGLRYLPDNLEFVGFSQTRSKRFSLAFLSRFRSLRQLYIESHKKDIAVLSELTSIEELTLRSITLPDLSLLLPLRQLVSLDIKLGGTKDLALLPEVGRLRYLELWMIRGLEDISSVGQVHTLQYLFLQALKRVESVPSLRDLRLLRRVHLETMKGLSDLQPIADAPVLEELLVIDMPHLQPEALRPFVGHRTLRAAAVGLGSLKKNAAAKSMLGLPDVGTLKGGFEYR
jgi:internalin A